MTIKPIRSNTDYEKALVLARELIGRSDQRSIDKLEVLQALIELWDKTHYSIEMVTAAEAIKFRMLQTGMKSRELIPYLGSKSRVSEILNGQRQLTVDQIRALHNHLRIPVASLIGPIRHEPVTRPSTTSVAAIDKLKALGAIKPNEDVSTFLARATKISPAVAMLRKTRTERTNAKTDFGALEAWCAAVLLKAERARLPTKPTRAWNFEEARRLARLSMLPDWPTRVKDTLAEVGVIFVTLDHLPGTFLDGAAIRRADGAPVIALTLRYDRLDNFWFTLLHEFAHVVCHLHGETSLILDDLDVKSSEGIEAQADEFARNALIPEDLWEKRMSANMSIEDVLSLAEEAGVHPAIIAGRWRYAYADYRRFSRLLGRGEVRAFLG